MNNSPSQRNPVRLLIMFIACAIIMCTLSSCLSGAHVPLDEQGEDSLRLLSLNVHYYVPGNDSTRWLERRHSLRSALQELQGDILAFQEMETFTGGHESGENIQLEWVLDSLPGYDAAAIGEPSLYPSTQPIVYRSELFEVVDQGFFFFSETPDVIYSRSFDGSYSAFASWVRFARKDSNSVFTVINIHTDAFSRVNRMGAIDLIIERSALLSQSGPVILLGDFNAAVGSRSFRLLENAGFRRVAMRGSSFHFQRGIHLIPAIDHILTSGEVESVGAAVLQRKWDGDWPSDHHFIYADLLIR